MGGLDSRVIRHKRQIIMSRMFRKTEQGKKKKSSAVLSIPDPASVLSISVNGTTIQLGQPTP